MKRLLLFAALILSTRNLNAQPDLLSIPGMAQAIADAAKSAKAVGTGTFDKKLSIGSMVPLRTLHDSSGVSYMAIGPGGSIKQGEHFKAGPVVIFDISAITRKLEAKSQWYQDHVAKISLPDFWIGPAAMPPLDESFTWKSYKSWLGLSISAGF